MWRCQLESLAQRQQRPTHHLVSDEPQHAACPAMERQLRDEQESTGGSKVRGTRPEHIRSLHSIVHPHLSLRFSGAADTTQPFCSCQHYIHLPDPARPKMVRIRQSSQSFSNIATCFLSCGQNVRLRSSGYRLKQVLRSWAGMPSLCSCSLS